MTQPATAGPAEGGLAAILVDGVGFTDHVCRRAGIDLDGTRRPLGLVVGLVEGSSENTSVVKTRLVGLRERGLDVPGRPILAVLYGTTASVADIPKVFHHPVIACDQRNKLRDVRDRLPDTLHGPVEAEAGRLAVRPRQRPPAPAALRASPEGQVTAAAVRRDSNADDVGEA